MLSPSEADLARRDPAIPGLTTVLDPDAFIVAMRRATPEAELRTAQITYARYKPRTDCRATYLVNVAGEQLDVDVRACRPDDLPSLLEGRTNIPGPLGSGSIVLEDCAVLVTVFPNDPKLPALQQLADAAKQKRLLRQLMPEWPNLWQGNLRRLRYRPGRHYEAELNGSDGSRVLLKACTRNAHARGKRNAVAFQSRGPLRISRLISYSDRRHVFAFEWLSGRPLIDLCAANELDVKAVSAAGAAIAALHAQHPDGLANWTREAEAADVVSLAAEIGFLCPQLAQRAEAVARRLAIQLAGAPLMQVALHGDLSARRVLVSHAEVAIVDLDWACCGDPADDLGNLIAQAERDALRGKLPAGRVEQMKAALLEGYGLATSRPPPQRVGLYTALELFRGARFPFRACEPEWPQRTEAMVDRSEEILNSSS